MPRISIKLLSAMALMLISHVCLADKVIETPVQYIPLAPPLDQAKAQISGITWCGENLLILPERPWFEVAADDPDPQNEIATFIYQLSRDQIDNYLSGKSNKALVANKIKLLENGIRNKIKHFDGYEAIVCSDQKVWLSIETEISEETYETNIVGAIFSGAGDNMEISIDTTQLHQVESQSGIDNYSDEALLVSDHKLISIHEANDTPRDKSSFATQINTLSGERSELPFPAISYRITDATSLDDKGYFWASNYAWSGECKWFTELDALAVKYGIGDTHKLEKIVERLVQFRWHGGKVERVDQAPIQLKLTQEDGRNWEGIVRYRDKGLLIMTDQYPQTLLGFVSFD